MLKSDIHSNYKYINKIVYEYDVQKKYVNENKLIFSPLGVQCTLIRQMAEETVLLNPLVET